MWRISMKMSPNRLLLVNIFSWKISLSIVYLYLQIYLGTFFFWYYLYLSFLRFFLKNIIVFRSRTHVIQFKKLFFEVISFKVFIKKKKIYKLFMHFSQNLLKQCIKNEYFFQALYSYKNFVRHSCLRVRTY